jgi:hypothetical protein
MLPGVVLVAIGCGALWSGVVTWLRTRGPRRSAPRPDDAVPAAVLALLSSLRARSGEEDPTVLNTAVFELAERGVLSIEPADSTHPALVHPASVPHADSLPPYQASVVSRLLHRRGTSAGPVPLSALQPGEDPSARVWHQHFLRQVRKDAAQRGLLRPQASGLAYTALLVLGLACSGAVTAGVAHYWRPHTAIPILVFVNAAIIAAASLHWATRMRLTTTGRRLLAVEARNPEPGPEAALAQLLRPGPQLPATAPAPQTGVKVLPGQLQPLPAHLVWSDYGGAWHPLNVGSRETYSLGGSLNGYAPLLFFAVLCLGGAFSTTHDSTHLATVSVIAFAALPAVVLIGAAMSLMRRRSLPKRAVLLGQVAKLWSVKRGDQRNGDYYYCTLDVGRAPDSVRLKVGRAVYQRLRVGEQVEVTVNPRRRRIKDIRPAARSW